MGGFAVGQATAQDFTDLSSYRPDPAPTSFLGAVQAGWDDGWRTRNSNVRENQLRDRLWDRHWQIEQALGQKVEPSQEMTAPQPGSAMGPGDSPNMRLPTLDAYEAKIQELKAQNPDRLSAIPSLDQVRARLGQDLQGVRDRADQGGLYHPIGSFLGESAAAITDPPNLAMSLLGPEAAAGRSLLARMAIMGGANAGMEALQVPGRLKDAQVAGPAYNPGEAGFDIAAAGFGGAAFEGAAAGLHALVRRLPGIDRWAAPPEARAAFTQAEQAARDDLVLGPLDGPSHEEGLDALARGAPKPDVEPAQELGSLFGEAPGPVAPTEAGISGEAEYLGRPIQQGTFDPAELKTDPGRFQYKADGDAEGVTARLKGVDAWDPTSSGKVIVFEDAAGNRVIADGHQRRALAMRMQEKGWDARLDGYVFREADGWTPRQVRTIAALKNMREGSGTILDAAKVFRDAPAALGDRSLPITGDFISQARNLARLDPEAFGAVINKVIPERYGAEIGAMAGDRPDLHAGLVKLLKEGEPANLDEARALVSEAKLDDWLKGEGETADLFGGVPPESTTIARAKVKAAILNSLRKDVRVYGQLVKHADAIEAGGNVLLRDANETAATVNRTALEVLSRLSLRAGDVGEAMAEAARQVLAGKRPADAARGVAQMVKSRIARGEELEGLRVQAIDPPAAGEASAKLLDKVDDPKTWAEVAKPAPEDAAIEGDAGLFPDLDAPGGEERAHQRLKACAPGE